MSVNTNILNKYLTIYTATPPDKIGAELGRVFSEQITNYFRERYNDDIKRGRPRKGNHLASTQTTLSKLKRRIEKTSLGSSAGEAAFLKQLRLKPEEAKQLERHKADMVDSKAIHIPEIDADAIILDCRELLDNPDPFVRLLALACLTGRRMGELLFSMKFEAPKLAHKTNSKYWTEISGIAKQREHERENYPRIREVPLFAPRDVVVAAIQKLRTDLPCDSIEQVNSKYGKPAQRAMKKYCPTLNNLHNFRRMYSLVCEHYFNENSCALPRLAAEYLGHKSTSSVVLTYLNFKVKNLGRLSFL